MSKLRCYFVCHPLHISLAINRCLTNCCVCDVANKNHLELRSNSPQWVYSYAPLVKPDGTPVDPPAAGAAGHAMKLHDQQVWVHAAGCLRPAVHHSLHYAAVYSVLLMLACFTRQLAVTQANTNSTEYTAAWRKE
eukprot:GHUV01030957.1.p1 GENE.GHUV01030957.1~~GHUV01030957.1.p1  ORF type:complete len:135 (-),score=39.40 GHUV01030957.1:858-1262(-)